MRGFADIYGNELIKEQLKSGIADGRIQHAYMLTGEKGSGKRTMTEAFLLELFCTDNDDTQARDVHRLDVLVLAGGACHLEDPTVLSLSETAGFGLELILELVCHRLFFCHFIVLQPYVSARSFCSFSLPLKVTLQRCPLIMFLL